MSSFKRKESSKPVQVYPGTRILPASTQTLLTSTGIASLDDVLGGGLPLTCSLVIAAPDVHSSYGELVLRYFVSQGLVSGHRVCLIGGSEDELGGFVRDCMWLRKDFESSVNDDEEGEGNGDDELQKVKIAWRYEKMKQFKTTVGNESLNGESYCQTFDLSSIMPEEVIDDALKKDRLHLINVGGRKDVLEEVTEYLSSDTSAPVRVCIPRMGSPIWGEVTAEKMLYLLHTLRARLRRYGHGCAAVGLAPYMSEKNWGGAGWLEKVGWASDGLISMGAFTANPGLSSVFPTHHGTVEIHRLPSPHTLNAPSDEFSELRGLRASGENNLGFKCTRRRLVIETVHLGIEGGTSERRVVEHERVQKKKKERVVQVGFATDYEF